MKRDDFVRNLKGADQGADLDSEMLQGIYDRIKENELKAGPDHVSQVKSSTLYKLICYCFEDCHCRQIEVA